jgi:hypothetical protein
MKAEHLGTAWLIMHLQCYKISTDKFYELVGKETKERKKKLEF